MTASEKKMIKNELEDIHKGLINDKYDKYKKCVSIIKKSTFNAIRILEI